VVVTLVRADDGEVLATRTILEDDVPGMGWAMIQFDPPLTVPVGEMIRVEVAADQPSSDPQNRYFWLGLTEIDAYPLGDSDVEDGWPGYDYAFQTYGMGETPAQGQPWSAVKAVY